MDELQKIIKLGALDLDGDGAVGKDDRWGLAVYNDSLQAFLVGGGGALAVKDENDIPYIDFASSKNIAVLEKIADFMYNSEYTVNQQVAPIHSQPGGFGAFEENRVLFLWARMFVINNLRNMEADFGIVPIPKYNEAQDNYYSLVNPYTGVLLGVPKSVGDLERTSIILEALSAESRYTLQPAYYDVTLTRKYTRDDESEAMLDIIFNSRVYDIGGVYSFNGLFTGFLNLAQKKDTNIVSYYDKNIEKMNNAIDKVVAAFQAMD